VSRLDGGHPAAEWGTGSVGHPPVPMGPVYEILRSTYPSAGDLAVDGQGGKPDAQASNRHLVAPPGSALATPNAVWTVIR
jgi:hypothetical protein